MNYINVTVILHIFSLIKNLSKILKVNSIERKFQSQHFFFDTSHLTFLLLILEKKNQENKI